MNECGVCPYLNTEGLLFHFNTFGKVGDDSSWFDAYLECGRVASTLHLSNKW